MNQNMRPVIKTKSSSKHIDSLLKNLPALGEIFDIHGVIGEGTFSSVLMATSKALSPLNQRSFAIKHLVPTCLPTRIEFELRCLKEIGGQDNVAGLDFCLRSQDTVVFVMPFCDHINFKEVVQKMDLAETRLFMKNLLIALRRVHSFGIIHRDVKPSNFLYDRINKRFLLIDFGLAQYIPGSNKKSNSSIVEQSESLKRKRNDHEESDLNVAKKFRNENFQKQKKKSSPFKKINIRQLAFKENIPISVDCNFLQNNINLQSAFKSPLKKNVPLKSPMKISTSVNIQSATRKLLFDDISTMTASNKLKQDVLKTVNKESKKDNKDEKFKSINFSRPQNVNSLRSSKKDAGAKCYCFGKPRMCAVCLLRKEQYAPRAGTPGFRPPEVLLKYYHQTTAVDIWAAGVMMLCILSGSYPFFRSPDDITALAEIMTMFGTEEVKRVARILGRHLITSEVHKPINLRRLCQVLKLRDQTKPCMECLVLDNETKKCKCGFSWNKFQYEDPFCDSAYDLLSRLLDINPATRISAEDALNHPFFTET